MKRVIISVFFLLCLIMSTILSCEFWDEEILLPITLPSLPEDYGNSLFIWEITVLHEDLVTDVFSLDGDCQSFFVRKKKEEILCLLGHATLLGEFSLKPAGLLIKGQGDTSLQFEDGPALSVLFELALGGFPLSRFNCQRFIEELDIRSDESPWFWDLDSLPDLIREEKFSLITLKNLPLFSVDLDWYGEDWVSEDIKIGKMGLSLLRLPPGRHRCFSLSSRLCRDIIVNNEGEYLYFDSFVEK